MKTKIIILFLLVSLVMCALPSCTADQEKYTTYSFDYFDTVTTITGYAASQTEFDETAEIILSALGEYHRLFTIYQRFEGLENLCTINELRNGAHNTVTVDRRIVDMLLYAKDMYYLTDGRVNVAMGSVLSLWHDYRTEGMRDPSSASLPPPDALAEAAAHTDIECMVIDSEACTVTLTDPAMTLDVGAVAKGYAVEMVAKTLEEQGISGYVLNVGGNVRTIGPKADGTAWTVGVENPQEDEEEPYLAYLNLRGEALVTSGSYQRYYLVDGKRYHHIIHPETLMPSEGYLSVSVVCKSSAMGDALSTALFCMTPEEGLSLIESLDGAEALWVKNDGTRFVSSQWNLYT